MYVTGHNTEKERQSLLIPPPAIKGHQTETKAFMCSDKSAMYQPEEGWTSHRRTENHRIKHCK